jgi:RND family efflux transporter MFP subunit
VRRYLLCIVLASCSEQPISVSTSTPLFESPSPPDKEAPRYVGVIVSTESADIAPQVGGVVSQVLVSVGDSVVVNQLLVQMDSTSMKEDVRAARASVAVANASLGQTKVSLAEAKRKVLVEKQGVAAGVSAPQALQDYEFVLKRAVGAVQMAQATQAIEAAQLGIAEERLANSSLRAPFSGVIAVRFLDAGSSVAAHTPILRIIGQKPAKIRFAVSQETAQALRVASDIKVEVEGYLTAVAAKIISVSPNIDAPSRLVFVEAEFSTNEALSMRPGLSAQVTLAQ